MVWKDETIKRVRKLRKETTDEEKILWSQLSNYEKFPARFRRQHPIGNYYVDFYSRKSMLVVELDGSQHAEENNQRYDERRTKYLESRGFLVLRFWNNEIRKELNRVLDIIWDNCHSRMKT